MRNLEAFTRADRPNNALLHVGYLAKAGLKSAYLLAAKGELAPKFSPQAPLKFLADFGYDHAGHHQEFTAQHLTGLIVIR